MVVHSEADILLMVLWFLFLSTLCVLVVQICRWIKNRYVLVHCWFCNAPNKIHVSARNAFVCSACKQYNGFTPSGDYNKEIPEMYQTTGNPSAFVSQSKEAFVSHSNVLCAICAQKQEQKLLELSRFEASADSKWDVEIEAFRQNLETRYDLCSPCKVKVRARVLQSDSKVLPDFLSWCQTRRRPKSTPPAWHLKLNSTHVDEDSGSVLRLLLRLVSFTGWTLFLCPRLYTQAVSRLCYVRYGPYNQLFSTLVGFLRRLGLRPEHCGRLVDFKVFAAPITSSKLLLSGLCVAQAALVILHWRRRRLQHGSSKANPFWILLDTCLLVYSASCLLSLASSSSAPSKFASKQSALQLLSSVPLLALLAIAGCAVSAGLGVLLWHWLPFCAQDLAQQKQRVQAAWPVGWDAQSVVSQQSTRFSQSPFSGADSVLTAAAATVDPLYSMRNLSLGSPKLQQRTTGSTSTFLRPPLLSPPPPTERCASAVLPPPTTAPSFYSLPYSLGGSQTAYAASAAPFQFAYRRSPNSCWQRANEDREEVDSHITSISQRVARRQSQNSPLSLASGVPGGWQSRRRKHHRNTGLLRCCIYFLFGRIDSWADVKAELICLANAVMVATLLMMIVHLFYTLGPALFL